MRIPRLLTIVGPATVLYLLAARASSSSGSSPEWLVAGLSLAFSFAPLMLLGARPGRRVSVLAVMGVSLAIAIASAQTGSPLLGSVHDLAWLTVALAMLALALPPSVPPMLRFGALAGFAAAALLAAVLSDAGLLPTASFAVVVVASMLGIGALHQFVLSDRGHTVEGALSAIAIVSLAVGLAYAWVGPFAGSLAMAVEVAVAILTWLGHLAWVDPRWRSLRRVGVPVAVACAVCFVATYTVSSPEELRRWELGLLALGAGLLWWASFSIVRRLSQRSVWVTSGRLADAAEAARHDLVGSTTLEDIASAVLIPIGRVFQSKAPVELYAFEPPLRVRLGTGERPMIRTADLPPEVTQSLLRGDPREPLDAAVVLPRVVREPEVRALAEVMRGGAIGAVIPCVHLDHLEGALVIPLGDRAEPLAEFELEELGRLGVALGGALCAALAQRRAQSHIHQLSDLKREAEDRIMGLEAQVDQLRGQCDVLGRGLAEDQTLHVAYSPSMRRVQTRAIEVATSFSPLFVVAGAGAPTLPVARFIHDRGPRWQGPFVVVDCASSPPDELPRLLFGGKNEAGGSFAYAAGGTILLRNVPALSRPAQERLAAELRNETGPRVIAAARSPLAWLRERGVLDPALERCFPEPHIVIPTLADRREDVPSLALLAIDRACRLLGREPVGINQSAMTALVDHDWPGDVVELELVIELAVSNTSGKTITPRDLPAFADRVEDAGDSLHGTYVEVERRVLQGALQRAGGNKSEAARSLGLKRTTFLDKLRRHGLDERTPEDVGGTALG